MRLRSYLLCIWAFLSALSFQGNATTGSTSSADEPVLTGLEATSWHVSYRYDLMYRLDDDGELVCLSFWNGECLSARRFWTVFFRHYRMREFSYDRLTHPCRNDGDAVNSYQREDGWCQDILNSITLVDGVKYHSRARMSYRYLWFRRAECLQFNSLRNYCLSNIRPEYLIGSYIWRYLTMRECDPQIARGCQGLLNSLRRPVSDDGIHVAFSDIFLESPYPHGSHGDFVIAIARGLHHSILAPPANMHIYPNFRESTPVNLFHPNLHIINRSLSGFGRSSVYRSYVSQITHNNENPPLMITSGGNTRNECTPEIADYARRVGIGTRGLRWGKPDMHPRANEFLRACDAVMLEAIDQGVDQNWLLVGPTFSFGQRPGETLKHRWVVAPYHHFVNGRNWQGTSFGTPYVTALAAEIYSRMPHLQAHEVARIIIDTATDMGEPGVDNTYGNGMVNPEGIRAFLREQGY